VFLIQGRKGDFLVLCRIGTETPTLVKQSYRTVLAVNPSNIAILLAVTGAVPHLLCRTAQPEPLVIS
jgi:hypothetical protein